MGLNPSSPHQRTHLPKATLRAGLETPDAAYSIAPLPSFKLAVLMRPIPRARSRTLHLRDLAFNKIIFFDAQRISYPLGHGDFSIASNIRREARLFLRQFFPPKNAFLNDNRRKTI
jgi:hypothetical protein